MTKKWIPVIFLIGGLLCNSLSMAQSRIFGDLEDLDKNKGAQEGKLVMPIGPPQKNNLFPFTPSANSKTLQFYVDKKNITIFKDEVRYTVVIQSPEGAEQILFSGIDCKQFLKITYARYDNNTWVEAKDQEWKPIPNLGYNNYQAYLGRRALCAGDSANSSIADINRRLQDVSIDTLF
ncbi:hypothetical protein PSHI8_02120 [Polynucleobacter sp. SHI8]|uniref:CNP1-like family protein n=1 Tax=unclassified Polynucleobacter TaxID=2640945 RepID=UPI002492CFD0|nr:MULTISPECIES: CNP1-like family protein [unclassified Polynucleobacter]BDW10130.1 hypothetical protein PSHI2_02120 [Polynucleobacter sp. SHI2]BDW12576.1 hypothetical protein PSHI8_02120 [Polynucleobacter sp. SHI8]